MNEQITKPTLRSKLLLPGLLVASLLMFGILLRQDWGDTPVGELPPFYWVVCALFLCILVAMILVGKNHARSMPAAIILSVIFLIHGTVFGKWQNSGADLAHKSFVGYPCTELNHVSKEYR